MLLPFQRIAAYLISTTACQTTPYRWQAQPSAALLRPLLAMGAGSLNDAREMFGQVREKYPFCRGTVSYINPVWWECLAPHDV